MEIITTNSVNHYYGDEVIKVHALKNINLSLNEGELTALVGPSGCGKSSLLHVLGAMLTPTSGKVTFMGEAIENFRSSQLARIRRDKIGFIFQNFALVNHLNALENVMLPLYPTNPSGLKERANKLLNRVGLHDRIYHRTNHLSGGERQRVAIARALINKPSIVFGDEITGNLDSSTGEAIFDLITELNEEENITFLIVTHDENIASVCRKTINMFDGYLTGDQ